MRSAKDAFRLFMDNVSCRRVLIFSEYSMSSGRLAVSMNPVAAAMAGLERGLNLVNWNSVSAVYCVWFVEYM